MGRVFFRVSSSRLPFRSVTGREDPLRPPLLTTASEGTLKLLRQWSIDFSLLTPGTVPEPELEIGELESAGMDTLWTTPNGRQSVAVAAILALGNLALCRGSALVKIGRQRKAIGMSRSIQKSQSTFS